MLNSYGQHKAAEAQRTAAEMAERYEAAKPHDAAAAQREAEQRAAIAAMHAENVAAEARMRRRQANLTAPNLYSRSGLMALLFLACYFAGVFALAHFLRN